MKKKSVLAICASAVVIAAIVMGVFLMKTNDMDNGGTKSTANLTGTWQVYSYNTDSTNPDSPFTLIEQQYIVFDETTMKYYVDGACVLSANYINEDAKIKLSNVDSKMDNFPPELAYEQITGIEDYVKLIDESEIREWRIVRNAGTIDQISYVDETSLEGNWKVLLHGTKVVNDEKVVFDIKNKKMTDYRPSGETTLNYSWKSKDRVEFANFGEIIFVKVSDNRIAMIQLNEGGVIWLLERE